jgi:MFS transporter, OPA family, sugar phosphate sensor protein UhpC
MSKIWDFFKTPEHIEEIKDSQEVDKKYKYWRMRIMYGMFLGYAVYYFTRMTFAFIMPELKQEGFSEVHLGWIITLFSVSYGISKFLSGILTDKANPRYIMGGGLIMTGLLNIAFGWSVSLVVFAITWGMNGYFQGWGSAPCHRLLTHWYSTSERGRWWGIWGTSHNVGAALLPIVAAYVITSTGYWPYAMYIPGLVAIFVGFFVINRLRDTPESLGLPSIERYHNEISPSQETKKASLPLKEILGKYVIKNKYIWMLSVSYFLVYTVRWAVANWSYYFLVDAQGYSKLAAASCVFWFEAGGFAGGLLAGIVSDVLFKGKRGPINAIFLLMIVPCSWLFWYSSSVPGMFIGTTVSMTFLGFFIYGPIMLLALAAAELTHKNAAATAVGFLGIIAYISSSITGGPLGHVIRDLGWDYFFIIIIGCSILGAICILPMFNVCPHEYKKKKLQHA